MSSTSPISSDSEYDIYTDYDLYLGGDDLEDKTPDPKHIIDAAILCSYFLMTHMQYLPPKRLFSISSKSHSVSSKCSSIFNILHNKNSSPSTKESDIEYTEEELLDLYDLRPDINQDKSDAKPNRSPSDNAHNNHSSSQSSKDSAEEEFIDLYDDLWP